jgi:hypothetical protein
MMMVGRVNQKEYFRFHASKDGLIHNDAKTAPSMGRNMHWGEQLMTLH